MSTTTGEPMIGRVTAWVALLASFALSWATWVALAILVGWDGRASLTLPDPVGWSATLALAWLFPLALDGYLVSALVLWLTTADPRIARFARINTYATAAVGVVVQVTYHATTTWLITRSAWMATVSGAIGALPPGIAALSVHMRVMLRNAAHDDARPAVPAATVRVRPSRVLRGAETLRASLDVLAGARPTSEPVVPVPAAAPPAEPDAGTADPDVPAASGRRTRTSRRPAPDTHDGADVGPVVADLAKRLRDAETLTGPDVAKELGVSVATAKRRISAARALNAQASGLTTEDFDIETAGAER